MFFLKLLSKLLKALRSAASPGQLAGGFILGMIIGLTPVWSLHNLVVVVLIIILNVNISMAIFSFALCSGFAYLLDPLFHSFGYWLLVDVSALYGLWKFMAETPLLALGRFNNTVVLGSFIVSVLLLIPMYFLVKHGVVLYREKIDARIQKWKIIQAIKSSKLYSLYQKISNLRD